MSATAVEPLASIRPGWPVEYGTAGPQYAVPKDEASKTKPKKAYENEPVKLNKIV